jgi:hypothetical protein
MAHLHQLPWHRRRDLSALAFVNGNYIAMIALAIVSIGMAVIARRFPRRRAT